MNIMSMSSQCLWLSSNKLSQNDKDNYQRLFKILFLMASHMIYNVLKVSNNT